MPAQPNADAARMVETLHLPAYVFDMSSLRFMAVNNALSALLGYTREELLQMTIEQIRPESDLPTLRRALREQPPEGGVEWRYLHKDGTVIFVRLTYRNMEYIAPSGVVNARFVVVSASHDLPTPAADAAFPGS